MKNRLFEVLDEMNVHDIEHNTRLVSLHPDVTSIQHTKKGTLVTVGVPEGILNIVHQQSGKQRVVLVIIDGAEYEKRIKGITNE